MSKKVLCRLKLENLEQILKTAKCILGDSYVTRHPLRESFASDCVNAAGMLGLISSVDWLDWLDEDPIATLQNLVDHLEEIAVVDL